MGTTIVVHVVGESDTGIENAHNAPTEQRRVRVRRWCAALDAAVTEGPEPVRHILRDGWRGDLGVIFRSTPLAGLLDALAAGPSPPAGVELISVSTGQDEAGVPTGSITAALHRALTAHPDVLGLPVRAVHPVDVEGFTDDAAAGHVARALHDRTEPVVLVWASGATGLGLAALAGVIEATPRFEVRNARDPSGPMDLTAPTTINPLVPWLLRLGYPRRVVELSEAGVLVPTPDADVVEYARTIADRLDAVAAAVPAAGGVGGFRPDIAALAEWVRCDLRRRDGSSGIAVRAWLEARYRQRRDHDLRGPHVADRGLTDLIDHARSGAGNRRRTLGEVLGQLDRLRRRQGLPPAVRAALNAPSGRWLLGPELGRVNRAVGSSAHDLTPLPGDIVSIIHKWLPQERTGERPPALPLFEPARGTALVIWAVGMPRDDVEPYAETLLTRAVPVELLRHAGRPDPAGLDVQCLLLGTGEPPPDPAMPDSGATRRPGGTIGLAEAHAEGLERSPGPFGRLSATARSVAGVSAAAARSTVATALNARRHAPDLIVVVATGPAPLVLGTFVEAVRYGQERAVPVLLECTNRGGPVTYHRVAAYLGADPVLVQLAADALRRLECDTASRLLALGSPDLQALVAATDELAEVLRNPDPAELVAQLHLFRYAQRIQDDEPGRLRVVHLAGTRAPEGSDLGNLRNRLPTGHGDEVPDTATVEKAIDKALRHGSGRMPDPHPHRWVDRYEQTVAALADLVETSRARSVGAAVRRAGT